LNFENESKNKAVDNKLPQFGTTGNNRSNEAALRCSLLTVRCFCREFPVKIKTGWERRRLACASSRF